MRIIRTGLAVLLAVALVAQARPAAAKETREGAPAYRIVALGDSITAGYQPNITEASQVYGYADRLLEQALFRGRAELLNYGVIGLTTEGLARLLAGVADGKPLTAADLQDFSRFEDPRVAELAGETAARTAEIRAALAEADLVAITIGANDFSGLARELAAAKTAALAQQLIDERLDGLVADYEEQLTAAVRTLHELAPDASIYVADQYLPVPAGLVDSAVHPLLLGVVDRLTDELGALTEKLRGEGVDIRAVGIGERFTKNEIAYTHIFADQDFHPNQRGYEAIATAFAEAVWGEYRKPSPRAADVPITVVIRGEELATPNKPKLLQGTTFLALRDVSNAMGARLDWDNKTETATFTQNGRVVRITIGAGTMEADGVRLPLAIPAYYEKSSGTKKTYVPLAVIADGLAYQVVYRPKLKTAFINL